MARSRAEKSATGSFIGSLAWETSNHIDPRLSSQSRIARKVAVMPIRIRKLIGTIALLVLVITWALVAMALAQVPAIAGNPYLAFVYYLVAGLGWVLPAMPLISWMSRQRQPGP
jgi:hypothetical protein